MSRQRRTADDFVRDMKAKQQHIADDIERKTSEELPPEQAGTWRCPKPDRSRPIIVKLQERVASRLFRFLSKFISVPKTQLEIYFGVQEPPEKMIVRAAF